MKVKDLVELVDCEVIILCETYRKDYDDTVQTITVRYYRGDIEKCPEDILDLTVKRLESEYEEIISIFVVEKYLPARRDNSSFKWNNE